MTVTLRSAHFRSGVSESDRWPEWLPTITKLYPAEYIDRGWYRASERLLDYVARVTTQYPDRSTDAEFLAGPLLEHFELHGPAGQAIGYSQILSTLKAYGADRDTTDVVLDDLVRAGKVERCPRDAKFLRKRRYSLVVPQKGLDPDSKIIAKDHKDSDSLSDKQGFRCDREITVGDRS